MLAWPLTLIHAPMPSSSTVGAGQAQSHRVSEDVLRPEARQVHGQGIEIDAGKRFCDLDVELDAR